MVKDSSGMNSTLPNVMMVGVEGEASSSAIVDTGASVVYLPSRFAFLIQNDSKPQPGIVDLAVGSTDKVIFLEDKVLITASIVGKKGYDIRCCEAAIFFDKEDDSILLGETWIKYTPESLSPYEDFRVRLQSYCLHQFSCWTSSNSRLQAALLPPVSMGINLETAARHKGPPGYQLNTTTREAVNKWFNDLTRQGLVAKVPKEWVNKVKPLPLLAVSKKDNTWRIVVDGSYLKSSTFIEPFTISVTKFLRNIQSEWTYIMQADVKTCFTQLLVKEPDCYASCFLHEGEIYYLRTMQMGFANASSNCQKALESAFSDLDL